MSTTAAADESDRVDNSSATITTDAPSEMDLSVVTAVPSSVDVHREIIEALARTARERESYLRHVEARIRRVTDMATRSGWNIDAFAEGVTSRIRHVRVDGANVHDDCIQYAFGGRDYDTLRAVRDEHAIRLRLDSAQAELDVMESALASSEPPPTTTA